MFSLRIHYRKDLYLMQILSYFFNVLIYLIPICCFLPFNLKIKQKLILFTILFINILLMGFALSNAGVVLLLISVCTYIAFIDSHRLMNICTVIAAYLICVLLDNLYSMAWDTVQLHILDLYDLLYGSHCLHFSCIGQTASFSYSQAAGSFIQAAPVTYSN